MKRLIIDIETRPSLAYVWDVWNQNIQPKQLIEEKSVISVVAKWRDNEEIFFYSTHHTGYKKMIRKVWKLLDEADAVIHYNGVKFDIPHLNQAFLELGLTPPSPFSQVDLLKTVRRQFNFTHNRLDHVARSLKIGEKVEHEGFALWLKCMSGDDDAWARMREYNEQDVLLTEALYVKLLPWIDNHPSHAAIRGDIRCTNCGSERLHNKGYRYTKTGRYKRYVCRACGTHCRDTHRDQSTPITSTGSW